ncbi:hypothetical protein [Paludibacterium sp.]|uniref:hypothetical protein n=1 Tax=Paludibacterium sp. TaxID=1917523 RepID=UPI0025D581F0|nr:hypothetical protein [Paludibacterium sp.]MBV8649527.1 hypothetical protein [Paludibacterium sp.]
MSSNNVSEVVNAQVELATSYLATDNDKLYVELGNIKHFVDRNPSYSNKFGFKISEEDYVRGSAMEKFGREFFKNSTSEVRKIICGHDKNSEKIRSDIMKAISGDSVTLTALITTLVAAASVPIAYAPIISAILVKIVILPAKDAFCSQWDSSVGV